MSKFHGFCTYPHGGRVSAAIIFSLLGAVLTTTFAVTSCRFVVLTYFSELGDFDDHFSNPTPDVLAKHSVGVGLFQWLRPFSIADWSEGSCAGYKTNQLEVITNNTFEFSRVIGIVVVIGGFGMLLSSLFLICLTFSKFQKYLFALGLLLLIGITPVTFYIQQSGLCTNVGTDPSCELDQGALVAIAGVILYLLCFLMTIFWLDTSEMSQKNIYHQQISIRDKRQREQLQRLAREKKLKNKNKNKKSKDTAADKDRNRSQSRTRSKKNGQQQKQKHPSTPSTVQDNDDHLDHANIQNIRRNNSANSARQILQELQDIEQGLGTSTNTRMGRTRSLQSQRSRSQHKKVPVVRTVIADEDSILTDGDDQYLEEKRLAASLGGRRQRSLSNSSRSRGSSGSQKRRQQQQQPRLSAKDYVRNVANTVHNQDRQQPLQNHRSFQSSNTEAIDKYGRVIGRTSSSGTNTNRNGKNKRGDEEGFEVFLGETLNQMDHGKSQGLYDI